MPRFGPPGGMGHLIDRPKETGQYICTFTYQCLYMARCTHTERARENPQHKNTKQQCKNELKRMYYSLKLCCTEAHHSLWNINKSTIECHGNVVNCCGRACNDGQELKIDDERSRACSRDRHVDCKIRSSVRRRTHPNL